MRHMHGLNLTGEEQQMSLQIQGAGEIPQAADDIQLVIDLQYNRAYYSI